MFKKRKLSIKRRDRLSYGRSPSQSPSVVRSRNKNFLKTASPKNFHTRKNRQPVIKTIRSKIPKKLSFIVKSLVFVAGLAFSIHMIWFSNFFNIESIEIKTENTAQTQLTNALVDDLKQYKHQNALFVDEAEIEEMLQKKYPEIEGIKIDINLPRTLEINFSEFPVAANISNISAESTKKYIVNSIGYVVHEGLDNPSLPYIKIRTEAPLNSETAIVEQQVLEYIRDAGAYFTEKFGMGIVEVEYKPIPREIHLRTDKYFYLWLDIQKPYELQLKKLKKALVKLDIFNESLSYIDLRITGESGEKIIYKRR
jgi:hypothetical protein